MLNLDLVKQYESALAARDLGYVQYQRHLENIAALEMELADKRETLERLDHQLKRFTDPNEGLRLKREFAEARERSLLLETAIGNLHRQTGALIADANAHGEKCRKVHREIFEVEYTRIADRLRGEAMELFALAKATIGPNEIYGRDGKLIGAFPYLEKTDHAPILAAIAKRLGIPVNVPKALNPAI